MLDARRFQVHYAYNVGLGAFIEICIFEHLHKISDTDLLRIEDVEEQLILFHISYPKNVAITQMTLHKSKIHTAKLRLW